MTLTLRHPLTTACALAAGALALAACGTSTAPHQSSSMGDMPGMAGAPGSNAPMSSSSMTGSSSTPTWANSMSGMPMSGMPMYAGTGLADTADGYTLRVLGSPTRAGASETVRFTIADPDGQPLAAYRLDQTKRLHFYAIRSDLSGFQHVHPTLGSDGMWTATLSTVAPGSWRLYAAFIPAAGPDIGKDLVLSSTVTVPGSGQRQQLQPASDTTTVDGFTVSLAGNATATPAGTLSVHVTRNGQPVTDLEPYLDTYAHMTGIRAGDLAFTHLHPTNAVKGAHGGPDLTFRTEFPEPGMWRLFLQFKVQGVLHTAALTMNVAAR